MAARTQQSLARRSLVAITAIALGLLALLGGATIWSNGSWTPKLGLDLEGGTQMVLAPQTNGSQSVTPDLISQARDIISQRVDASGFSGAEVATLGDTNIVVSVPGVVDEATKNAIEKSSAMQFRPVLLAAPVAPVVEPSPTASPSTSGSASPSASASAKPSATASPTASASPSASASPTPSASASPKPSASPSASTPTPSDPTAVSAPGASAAVTVPASIVAIAASPPK